MSATPGTDPAPPSAARATVGRRASRGPWHIAVDVVAGRPAAAFLIFITAYFAIQTVLRIVSAPALGPDEAELMLTTQVLASGYGAQPPLYTWIQIGAFKLLGTGIPAIAIVKSLVLWSTFAAVFAAGRLLLSDTRRAAATSLTLFTVPQLAWEPQRALTHTPIAVAAAAVTLLVVVAIIRRGGLALYFALGVCLALGALSKFNYVLFALALLGAAASIPAYRAVILRPAMPVALAVAATLLALPAEWVVSQMSATLSRTAQFAIDSRSGWLVAAANGLRATAIAFLEFATLPIVVMAAIAFAPPRIRPLAKLPLRDEARFVLRIVAIGMAIVIVLALTARGTDPRDRWLQPLLFVLPLAFFLLFEQRFSAQRLRVLTIVSVTLGLAVMVGLAAQHAFADSRIWRPPGDLAPYATFERQIRALGFGRGYILGATGSIAGNLKLRFPDSAATTPEDGARVFSALPGAAPALVAWQGDSVPPALAGLVEMLCGIDLASALPTALAAAYDRAPGTLYGLTVAIVPACAPRAYAEGLPAAAPNRT